jgi:hypothetical protein
MEAIEEIMDNLHIDTPGCQVTSYAITADLETFPKPRSQYLNTFFKGDFQFVLAFYSDESMFPVLFVYGIATSQTVYA